MAKVIKAFARFALAALVCLAMAHAQSVGKFAETKVVPFVGYWANSLNTSNTHAASLFTDSDGSQWLCFAEQGTGIGLSIAHVANGYSTIAHDVLPNFTSSDQHDACSIAIDKNGYIHLTYNMHITALVYYKSVRPRYPYLWSGPLSMLGTNEDSQSFTELFTNPANGELYYTFQHGGGNYGVQFFYHYNATTATWESAAGTGTAGQLDNYQISANPRTFFLSGLPQWDKTTGNLWFNYQVASGNFSLGACGDTGTTPPNPCAEYLLGWNGTAFIKFGGAAQAMPVDFSNSTPVYTITPGLDANFTILDNFSINGAGVFFIPYADQDSNSYWQVYVLESSTGSFVRHQLTSNSNVFAPPGGITWVGVGAPWSQSPAAMSSAACTWVIYPDVYNWGAGELAYESCDNFSTSAPSYLTTRFNPNIIVFPDQVANYLNGTISFAFMYSNDTQYHFSNVFSSASPDIGTIWLETMSPGGSSISGGMSFFGKTSIQ